MFCLLCFQLLFDELLERLKEKEEKEAKKRQRLADDFSDRSVILNQGIAKTFYT